MADQLQANDSSWFRRIVPGFGEPGVTSWNGRTGDVVGTLANIYAFGLGDNPTADNQFAGPKYTVTYPLQNDGAGGFLGQGAFETGSLTADEGAFQLIRRNALSTMNQAKDFLWASMNDPAWSGSGDTLSPVQTFYMEKVFYGNQPTNSTVWDSNRQAPIGARSFAWVDGPLFHYNPTPGQGFGLGTGRGMEHDVWLWNHATTDLRQVQSLRPYGQRINQMRVNAHGLYPADFTQVTYSDISALTAGDGIGYVLGVGSLFDLNGSVPRAWFSAIATGVPSGLALDSEWYASIASYAGNPPITGQSTVTEVAKFRAIKGIEVNAGGLQLGTVDSTTFPVSDAGAARWIWDTARGPLLSQDGAGYQPQPGAYFLDNIDGTTIGDKGVLVPARPGLTFIVSRTLMIVRSVTGTATGNVVGGVGVSPTFNNVTSGLAIATTAQINAGVGFPVSTNVNGYNAPSVAGTALDLDITTAVTGATAFTFGFGVLGYWVTR